MDADEVERSLRSLVDAGILVQQGDRYKSARDFGIMMIEAWTTEHPNEAEQFLRYHLLMCLTAGDTTAIDTSYVALNALVHHQAGTPFTIDPARVREELNEVFAAWLRKIRGADLALIRPLDRRRVRARPKGRR